MASPPAHTQVLIVGGGPAGSYAAAALVREGLHVVLFEAAEFPRYHVGESLIPSARHHLSFIGADSKVEAAGFTVKPGAAMKFTQHKQTGYTDFIALGADRYVWNVCRADFDTLLLNHAKDEGTLVFQRTKVTNITFAETGRPISATYTCAADAASSSGSPTERTITFDYLIDASGRAGILSTRYLKTRNYNKALKNVATWAYWRDAGTYGAGTSAEGAPLFEALSDESGWAWFIPLAGGLTSVGIVRDQQAIVSKAYSPAESPPTSLNVPPRPPTTPVRATRPRGSSLLSPSTPISPLFAKFALDTPSTAPSTPPSLSPAAVPKLGLHITLPTSAAPPSPTSSYDGAPLDLPFSPGGSLAGDRRSSATDVGDRISSGRGAQRYLAALELAPAVRDLLGSQAELSRHGDPSSVARATEDASTGTDAWEDAFIRTASDFSYSAASYGGEGYRIVGDAGAFIDPFFSSGIHLAMTSALAAAASIASAVRGEVAESDASTWFTSRVTVSYTRFLVVVLSAYKQMRSQSTDVLNDVGENNFDRAFRTLRPVIQGNADLGPCATEEEIQRALDFCTDLFTPTSPSEHAAVRTRIAAMSVADSASRVETIMHTTQPGLATAPPRIHGRKRSGTIDKVLQWFKGPDEDDDHPLRPTLPPRADSEPLLSNLDALLDVRAPVLGAQTLEAAASITSRGKSAASGKDAAAEAEEETRRVLTKINARRVIHSEHGGLHSLEEEALGALGLRVRLERGRLGLVRDPEHIEGPQTTCA
ncbi:FAD/NAD(P)-binding domain-containing protein [Peniophora sp. CONT]|nr:FAD/NAD(P)-binding domain-containing protein [Peniophora sp. CONT]